MERIQNFRALNLFLNSLPFRDKINTCYLNKDCLNNMLIENDEVIEFSCDNNEIKYKDCFYLSLLIMNNPELYLYSYNIDFIEKINEYNNSENKILKKILLSKILLIIIDNQIEFIEEKDINKHLNKLKEENSNFIKDNINVFKEFGLNYDLNIIIKNKKIDEIYIEIINGLIQNNKFDDYEYLKDILINQLEIQNIDITNKIFKELTRVLNIDESCVKKYLISKPSDLLIENKINFYYFWFNYILKDYEYIYKIPFFYNICINKYIIKTINDSEFYYKKYFIDDKLKYNLKYYKLMDCEDKINLVSNLINEEYGNYDDVLDDYEEFKRIENINKIHNNKIEINKNVLNFFFYNYKIIKDFKICNNLCLVSNIFKKSSFEFILENESNKYEIININDIIYNKEEFNYKMLNEIKENEIYQNYIQIISKLKKFLSFMEKIKTITLNKYKFKDLKFILIFKNLDDDNKKSECSYSLIDTPGFTNKDENIFADLTEFCKFIEKANKYHMNESKSSNKNIDESKTISLFSSLSSKSSFQNNIYSETQAFGENEETEITFEKETRAEKDEKLKYLNILILNDNNVQDTNIIENLINIIKSKKDGKPITYSENNIYSIKLEKNKIIITELVSEIKESFSLPFELKDGKYLIFSEKGIFIDNPSNEIEANKETMIEQKCLLRNGEEIITIVKCYENNQENNKVKILDYNIKEKLENSNYFLNYSNNNNSLYLINNSLLCISVKTEENNYGIYAIDITNNEDEIFHLTSGFKINYFCGMDNNSKNKDFVFTIGEEDNKWKIKLFKIYKNIFGTIKIEEKEEIYESNNLINKIIYIEKNRKLLIA